MGLGKVQFGAIVRDNQDQRHARGALQIWNQEGFCGGDEPGQTNTPRRRF